MSCDATARSLAGETGRGRSPLSYVAGRSGRHAARPVPRLPLRPGRNAARPALAAARMKWLPLDWLPDAVARAPLSIYTKLLVAVLTLATLPVVVGPAGLA